MSRKERLVIIGNGMAGARFAEELVARGGRDRYEIAIFGDEPYGNYNRILLSGVLAGTHSSHDVFLNPLAWYRDHGVTLHAGHRIDSIDRTHKVVHSGRLAAPYDVLVIATGSSAFVPRIAGIHTDSGLIEGAFVFRTLDDCAAIRKAATTARRAAVIGGGLLGLEAARGLLGFVGQVEVVHLASHLMEMQLDEPAGKILAESVSKMGVRVHVQKQTTGVRGNPVEALLFADGTELACDVVVVSAGVRPNAELARAAGLAVKRGIVVDDTLATNDANVFAIGECAEHRGVVHGLVAPGWDQARVLAERLMGRETTYVGSKTSTKLKVAGVDLAVMGERNVLATDEVVTYSEPKKGIYKKLVVRDGKLIGAILLGDTRSATSLLQVFDRGEELPDTRGELLFPQAGQKAVRVEDLADDAQICNCNGVTKGAIVSAVRGGKRSLKTLCDATRAGTGCGSCKEQVECLLAYAADRAVTEDPSKHWYVPAFERDASEASEAE